MIIKVCMTVGGFERRDIGQVDILDNFNGDLPRKIKKKLRRNYLELIDDSDNCQCMEFYRGDVFVGCTKLKCRKTNNCSCCPFGDCQDNIFDE